MMITKRVYSKRKPYNAKAKKRWRRAEWVTGEGRYATVSDCQDIQTVMLHETMDEAVKVKEQIDSTGCGSKCDSRRHKIVDMDAGPSTTRRRNSIVKVLLVGKVSGDTIRVWCPFCKTHHTHGWAAEDSQADAVSHRAAHCSNRESPLLAGGYFIGREPA